MVGHSPLGVGCVWPQPAPKTGWLAAPGQDPARLPPAPHPFSLRSLKLALRATERRALVPRACGPVTGTGTSVHYEGDEAAEQGRCRGTRKPVGVWGGCCSQAY